MILKVIRINSGAGVIIPKVYLETLGIKIGDAVKVDIKRINPDKIST